MDNTALTVIDSKEILPIGVSKQVLLDEFIESQDVRPSSKWLYQRTLNQFFIWLEKGLYNPSTLTRRDILAYKNDLTEKGLSSLTIGSYLTVVRKFYEWSEANKYYPNIAKGIKTPRRKQIFKKQALTTDQSKALLLYFQKQEDKGLRDYAIINLAIRTGLRTIEIINANVEDITYKQGKRILLIKGKGEIEKNNFVILTDKTYSVIDTYLKTRGPLKGSIPLFVSNSNNSKGKRLTTRTISKIAKEGLKAIGIDSVHITAHSLRHTLAVNILRSGGSLMDAQGVLRHTNPSTTQIYTKTIEEEIRIKNAPEELIDNIF